MKANTRFKRAVVVIVLHMALSASVWAESGDAAIKRTAMESSTITSAGYRPRGGLLEIEFRSGAVYRYRGVPKAVFTAFTKAESKGRFFGSEIRGRYAFEKMDGAHQ